MSDLRTVRKEKKLSQEDLADLIGMRQSSLTEVETGRRLPRKSTRLKIERILGSDIDWICTLSRDKVHIGYALKELINLGEPGASDRIRFCRSYLSALNTLIQYNSLKTSDIFKIVPNIKGFLSKLCLNTQPWTTPTNSY